MIMSALEHRLRVRDGICDYMLGSLVYTAVELQLEDGGAHKRRRRIFDAFEKDHGHEAEESSLEERTAPLSCPRLARRQVSDGSEVRDHSEERPTVHTVLQTILEEV